MQRFIELSASWPYLPHFRVVAEYESLSRAARKLGISSAALSKAIRALERVLEVELFDRAGGKLRLTDPGRALLASVRGVMRDLDDAIAAARGNALPPLIRIGVDAAWVGLVISLDLAASLELSDPPVAIARALLRGEVDVVFHVEPIVHAELDSVACVHLRRTACASTRYVERGLALPFAALRPHDGWPAELARRVALTTGSLAHALGAAASCELAVVAPVELARSFGLVELAAAPACDPITLWATIRGARSGASAAARWRDVALRRLAARPG